MEQRTEEWFAARAGIITASQVAVIAAGTKSKTAQDYIYRKRWELRNGVCAPAYVNGAMERGTELEAAARQAYELETFCVVEEVGFVKHPDYDFIGCSPDGLVGDDGLVEIKCPAETSAHLHEQHMENGYYAKAYKHQVNLQLACTGREWCDVVSYFPLDVQPIAVWRVERNEKEIDKLIKACLAAWEEIRR